MLNIESLLSGNLHFVTFDANIVTSMERLSAFKNTSNWREYLPPTPEEVSAMEQQAAERNHHRQVFYNILYALIFSLVIASHIFVEYMIG